MLHEKNLRCLLHTWQTQKLALPIAVMYKWPPEQDEGSPDVTSRAIKASPAYFCLQRSSHYPITL